VRTEESIPAVRRVLGAFTVAAARRSLGALAILALGIGSAAIAGAGTAGATTPQSTGSSTGIPSDNYWLADAQGAVWDFGNAGAFGSAAGLPLNHPIVTMTATKDQQGYWLVASDGGIFSYGDATFYGSTGSIALNKPIVGMAATPDGKGYWLVASDGGIFSYGDGAFYGSTGSIHLVQPIVGMAATPDGKGYWMVASDGGIFNFGDAAFAGSAAGGPSLDPAERVVSTATGHGYWVEEQNGTAYAFGDAAGAPPTEALMFAPATPGDRTVLFAFAQLGKPYIWGGNGPVGYDCSGLALAAWESVGVGFARVSDDQYNTAGQPVALSSLSAGDLVFWGTSQTDWTTVYHTAIYVGGDQIVEATGDHVQLNSLGQWGSGDLMPNGRRP
jgi:cell wall-associated NlpC family hydrolase